MEIELSDSLNLTDAEKKALTEKLASTLVDTVQATQAAVTNVQSIEQTKTETVKVQSKAKAILT
jgi:hypothetical protein